MTEQLRVPVSPAAASPVAGEQIRSSSRLEHNEATISGVIESDAVPGGALFGQEVLYFVLRAVRLSGTVDRIPVCIPLSVVHRHGLALCAGDTLVVFGQLRTYYSEQDSHVQTILYATVAALSNSDPHLNIVRLTGEVTKPPVFNVTPFGRELTVTNLCTLYSDSTYRGRAHIPVMFWGGFAHAARLYQPHELISVQGRFQSREYQKVMPDGSSQTRTAHELSVHHCCPVEHNLLHRREKFEKTY